jgi:hypothetical protein
MEHMRNILVPLMAVVLLAATPLALSACGANINPAPEYAWTFSVTVTPDTSECVNLGDASEESYDYGLVVEGSAVEVYSDDGKLADGTLTGRFIEYESAAPFTDRRLSADGAPLEVEWTIYGEVLFADQDLNSSDDGNDNFEEITVFSADEGTDIEVGCVHRSTTRWSRTN